MSIHAFIIWLETIRTLCIIDTNDTIKMIDALIALLESKENN